MPFRQVAAAGVPEPDDGQVPLPRPLALSRWVRGRGKVRVGGHQDAQSLRLVRAEPVYQVVKVVIVMGRSHVQQSTAAHTQPPK